MTKKIFLILFEILLTDNGIEFYDIPTICESFPDINLFYCHPYSSYEKEEIENNHELFRRIIPKGVSLNIYTQEDFNLICSHVNSLRRKELDGQCSFNLVEQYIPKEILASLGMNKIKASKVILNPYLLGQKNIDNIPKYLDDKIIEEYEI